MVENVTYSELVSIIVKQFNKFRNNPISLLPILEQRSMNYRDKYYYYQGNPKIKMQTAEGVTPVKEVILLINKLNRLPNFNWSYELHTIANKRAQTLSNTDQVDPAFWSQRQKLSQLVARQLQVASQVSEHFLYGYCHPQDILLQLLIDDNSPKKQNRNQILNPLINFIGIGVQQHIKYKFVIVIIFAQWVDPKRNNKMKQIVRDVKNQSIKPQPVLNNQKPIPKNIQQKPIKKIQSKEILPAPELHESTPKCKICSIF